MKGIKQHNHQQRLKVLEELVPLVKKKFGDNLLAIAARGSVARNIDGPYSDIELFAFLREMPAGSTGAYGKMRKIRNGLLVELIWCTKATYINEVKEVQPLWFGSGADVLLPLFNKEFIEAINGYQVQDLKRKCLEQAVKNWDKVQEATTKVLNAAAKEDQEALAVVMHDMFTNMLKTLSFINQQPFTTFSRLIPESKQFKIQPKEFPELIEIIVNGRFGEFEKIMDVVTAIFTDLEEYLENNGQQLYQDYINNGADLA